MIRKDGRTERQLRPLRLSTDFVRFAEGSCLVEWGETKVLCCASVEDRCPPHVAPGSGWVTAEYDMLPRANRERSRREIDKLKRAGRSAEIQRLIGRSLRAAVDLRKLGGFTITVDCDVLQGDGGTRSAAVTGGFVALALACRRLQQEGSLHQDPLLYYVAGISAGIVDNRLLLDLPYEEDSRAMVDLNCVMNEAGVLIEMQGTGERRGFTMSEQQELLNLCRDGLTKVFALQKAAIEGGAKG